MRAIKIFCVLAWAGAGSPAWADLCHDVMKLGAHNDQMVLDLPSGGPAEKCTRSLMLSGDVQTHCRWAFPYRAQAATQAFEALNVAISRCLGPTARMTSDPDVNHPDFYDLQIFQFGDQEIGISLKNKAALSQTFVFVRVTASQ